MAVRDGVLLLLALVPGLTEDTVTEGLVAFLRDGTTPSALCTATVLPESATVLAAPTAADQAIGTLASGDTVQVWRQTGDWYFVSTDDLAGWLHTSWCEVA